MSVKLRAATSPTFSVPRRVWLPGRQGTGGGCSQLSEATTSVRVHVPTRSLSHGTRGSLSSGVWLCCTSQRGREGGARQGAWHGPPAFCTYVPLANDTPFEDSLLMQPGVRGGGAGEGTTHVLSVCNQWKGLVRSLQLRQGWASGKVPSPLPNPLDCLPTVTSSWIPSVAPGAHCLRCPPRPHPPPYIILGRGSEPTERTLDILAPASLSACWVTLVQEYISLGFWVTTEGSLRPCQLCQLGG